MLHSEFAHFAPLWSDKVMQHQMRYSTSAHTQDDHNPKLSDCQRRKVTKTNQEICSRKAVFKSKKEMTSCLVLFSKYKTRKQVFSKEKLDELLVTVEMSVSQPAGINQKNTRKAQPLIIMAGQKCTY